MGPDSITMFLVMTTTETRRPLGPCPLTGYPLEAVTTETPVFVILDDIDGRTELLPSATLEDAKTIARTYRDRLGRSGVRLCRETKTARRVEFADDGSGFEFDEVFGDRLAAGEFDGPECAPLWAARQAL